MKNKYSKKLIAILLCVSFLIPLSSKSFAAGSATPILGKPTTTVHEMKLWASSRNANQLFIDLAPLYYSVSVQKGVDPAVTYTQSAKETNFLRFGGVLDASYFNPCGLKTTAGGGDKVPSAHTRFKSWEEGITAQVDHLALYAGANGYPKDDTPDPRHFASICGKAPMVEDLGGRWAPSKNYGIEVVNLMKELYSFPYSSVKRISGTSRFETSALINKNANIDSDIAVISNGHSFPDSIAASILAGNLNAHLLLSDPGRVTGEIANTINTGTISTVYLVGGNNLPSSYVDTLSSKGIEVKYLKGNSRYDTAVKVAEEDSSKEIVFLANGISFPDALSIAGVAKMKNANLLFTDGKTLNEDVMNIIKDASEVYLIGGENSISKEIENKVKNVVSSVSRISGKTRYETSVQIANNYYSNPEFVLLASGENFADALSGTALANKLNAPIVLSQKTKTPDELISYLRNKKINTLYILGGNGSIGNAVERQIKSVLDV